MSEIITIEAAPRTTFKVNLVGTVYDVRPIKAAMAIGLKNSMASAKENPEKMMVEFRKVINMLFGKAVGAKVSKRLDDPDDLLDIDHISELMQAVTVRATGNPTM